MGLLDGKAAIVTGSARGIGRATAELFASEGAKVLINDLDADVAEQAAGEIDGETAVHAGDLTKPDAPDQLVAAGVDAFGAIDIVVNNAGYTWDGVAHRMTDEQFQAMLDIHTIVPFRVARALAPHWREAAKAERGEGKEVFRKLINISSTSGTMGNAGQINYSAAKMAVVGMTKTLAKEWGQFKINVNAVAFGFVETRLTAAKEAGGEMTAPGGEKIELGIPEQMRAMASAIIPLGRPATPDEASGPVLFLGLAAGQLHARPGPQRDRRDVRRHVHLARTLQTGASRGLREDRIGHALTVRSLTGPPCIPRPAWFSRPQRLSHELSRPCRSDLAPAPAGGGAAYVALPGDWRAAGAGRSRRAAERCCCSTTSERRAASSAPLPCSTSSDGDERRRSSPRKAAIRRTRPGTTT